jgi:hypothetical protein
MAKGIDLGKKLGSLLQASTVDPEEPHYPHLHIEGNDDPRLLDMPDHGEARIKYKVKHKEHEEHDDNGKKKHRYSVHLEVHHFYPPDKEPAPPRNDMDEARKSMNDYFSKLK